MVSVNILVSQEQLIFSSHFIILNNLRDVIISYSPHY